MLVQHFISRVGPAEARSRINGISSGALAMLKAYDWPGNIRQLENAIFRAVVLAEGNVLTADEFPQIKAQVEGIDESALDMVVPASISDIAERTMPHDAGSAELPVAKSSGTPLEDRFGLVRALDERGNVRPLADVENEMIRLAIEHYKGQMSEVARRLGIGRSTLYRKLKEMGIEPEEGRAERMAS